MLIIPAIDLKDGKCVRLRQGRAEDVTVFGDDPAAMGLKWQAAGAQRRSAVGRESKAHPAFCIIPSLDAERYHLPPILRL